MPKPTHAHMSKTINKYKTDAWKDMTRQQMEYYMGAKLIEIGVNPKSAIYRWSIEDQGIKEVWTYSAYWGDSKEQLLKEESQNSSI